MQKTFKIGLVVKPQGIRGELKVQPLTDDINRFKKLKTVLIDEETYRVTRVSIGGGTVILSLDGVTDRNVAELFRGKFLVVERADAVELEKDNYFIADIIGCTLLTDDGQKIGEIIDVTSARTDVFTVKSGDDKIIRFPFLKDLLVSVDIENEKVTVKAKRFAEVACYED